MYQHDRHPVRPRPPRRRATAGDTLFAVIVAGLGLVLAGVVLVAGGGAAWLSGLVSGPDGAAALTSTSPGIPAPTEPAGPVATPPGAPEATPTEAPAPTSEPSPAPTASTSPKPAAGPYSMNLYRPGVFVHQADEEWCVAAAVQNMLNVIRLREEGRAPDTTARSQRALYRRIVELTSWDDSHNGGTGPGGWARILTEKGYPYELRVYDTRNAAMKAAATALRETRRPVGILAWAGVHSWVLTGFTATADPARTRNFVVTTARILDPWYPWVSTRWPRSEKPNAPRDAADLKANVKPWRLASGPYEGRDGRFLLVVPLEP